MSGGVKNWCGIEWCMGHPHESERHLVDTARTVIANDFEGRGDDDRCMA